MKRAALLSVSDKEGLVPFAKGLIQQGVALLSTGGTAKALLAAGVPVTEVSDYTGFPEMMDGRLKTLHPKVHGGILGREEDKSLMEGQGMWSIDFVIVNLYPFRATIEKPDCTFEKAIENIDIGGPTMLRAAAKNHGRVTVICDPKDYSVVLEELREGNGYVSEETRKELAEKVFVHTSEYDEAIGDYLAGH